MCFIPVTVTRDTMAPKRIRGPGDIHTLLLACEIPHWFTPSDDLKSEKGLQEYIVTFLAYCFTADAVYGGTMVLYSYHSIYYDVVF